MCSSDLNFFLVANKHFLESLFVFFVNLEPKVFHARKAVHIIHVLGSNVGGYTLTLNLAKKMNVPIETAHQFKVLNGLNPGPRQARITGALQPSLHKMTNEIKRVMRYYTDRFPNEKKIEQILIVGGGGNVPGIGEFFTNELLMPARVASPWQLLNFGNLEQPAKQLRSQLSPVAGLALIRQEDIYD